VRTLITSLVLCVLCSAGCGDSIDIISPSSEDRIDYSSFVEEYRERILGKWSTQSPASSRNTRYNEFTETLEFSKQEPFHRTLVSGHLIDGPLSETVDSLTGRWYIYYDQFLDRVVLEIEITWTPQSESHHIGEVFTKELHFPDTDRMVIAGKLYKRVK